MWPWLKFALWAVGAIVFVVAMFKRAGWRSVSEGLRTNVTAMIDVAEVGVVFVMFTLMLLAWVTSDPSP